STRRYLDDTNVLETRFTTSTGDVELVDFMPMGGADIETNRIIRRIRGLSGTTRLNVSLDPRFDYARRDPQWEAHEDQGVRATAGDDAVTLYAQGRFEIGSSGATTTLDIVEGETRWLTLVYRRRPRLWQPPRDEALAQLLDDTC